MAKREMSIATPLAHLVGPGKLKVINSQLAYINSKGDSMRLDPRALSTLLCYGQVGITDQAFQLLFQHEVEVAWMTPAGTRCRGRLVKSEPSTTALRIAQHQILSQPQHRLVLASQIVQGKIASQLEALRHYQRHGQSEAASVRSSLQEAETNCKAVENVEQLRGLEGSTSAVWFRFFGGLLKEPWEFNQRLRRPPPDPINAMLSLGYTWLLTRVIARCEALGLEVQLGALHEYRPGRPSLACDIMEPLRVPAVDRWLLPLCNRLTIQPEDFVQEEKGIRLKSQIFGRMLHSWEQHWLDKGLETSLQDWLNVVIRYCRDQYNEA